ncbi:ATP-dependent DNA helicase Rep [Bacteriovorax stolpii]|uniref:DNA 3'-5' helicase n=1 Tax=Bacteriovorax stolpii TaxID=960 RepID=A0A2K9NRG9_BACTC|nr:UvrD-helicase domain-containing protein [Bacteriovorax stolpii]AUN98109.1 ATP-dependent DNA helicase Rep [Bacteriovorax stolpii]QDK41911.1 ATP-dependent DNA helicase Rep [Bacteriovorax stolpii]TDP52021.1 DNA helicase-2/ATP-dependent DNA helicase PcrA [Bacteriovorax stolpii]
MISLSGLNDKQREAAETVEGPVLILAGAGSGKTRTITYRIAHMVDNLGIKGDSILGVSFTNKAAKEMRERVVTLLGAKKSRKIALLTFHSLGVRILKKEIDKLGYHLNFSIYDQSDQLAIVREALKLYHAEKKFDQKDVQSKISYLKNAGISENDFADSPHFNPEDPYSHATEYAYRYYQEKLKFYNAIDFDDILFLTLRLFRENPDIARAYSEKYQFIMVDEYQDTNALQFELIRHLTVTHNNLCVVGDDDQSIYGFRGADISNILEFEKTFPEAKVVKLEENYRSVSSILDLANNVIKENKKRRDKTLWSQKKSDHTPLLWAMGDTDHEAEVIVEDIVRHQGKGGHLGDIAILYRSNTQAPPIEDQLRMSQVPYTIIGGQKFYDKKEVKDLMSYLFVIMNPSDQMAIRRILNIPHRGIGNATLEKYLAKSQEDNIPLFDALEKYPAIDPQRSAGIIKFVDLIRKFKKVFEMHTLSQSISTLIEEIDYLNFIDKQYDNAKQVERRRNDVMHFIESAERFTNYYKENANLKNFCERLLLQDSQDKEEMDEEHDGDVRKNEVTLMTLHSSKGLEFKNVYMIGIEEETLPHKKTISQGEDISEERRLCYVGITRAQEKLVMTYCKQRKLFGKETPRFVSRFLNTLAADNLFIEQDRTTFGHMSEEEATDYKKSFFSNLLGNLKDD